MKVPNLEHVSAVWSNLIVFIIIMSNSVLKM